MPEPEPQGGPPPAVTPGPRRPTGCLRACTVLVGLGFMASMALLVVIWTFSDLIVGRVVQAQVEAFERALERAQIAREEREHGREVARALGEAITKQQIKRDDNLDEWPRVERILADFRAATEGGQQPLTAVQARDYIDKMEEVLRDFRERQGEKPPQPR